ncbi:MAG: hypothetical protein B6D45_09495, partial [Ignavibacteriales bacterium UTCHB3]
MKHPAKIFFFLLFSLTVAFPQGIGSDFFTRTDIGMTSPGAMRYSLYGYDNPAFLSAFSGNDLVVFGSSPLNDPAYSRWGFISASEFGSFYLSNTEQNGKKVTDLAYNVGIGGRSFGIGAGYARSNGDAEYFGKESSYWQVGAFWRPGKYLSLSALGIFPQNTEKQEYVFSAAVRP